MLKNEINQEVKNIVNLMGQQVSFISSLKVENNVYSEEIKGTVTDIALSLDGTHSISVDSGDYFILSDLLEFQILTDC